MRPFILFPLPSSLITLILLFPPRGFSEESWPYNLPKDVKYFPEDEVHVKRDLELQRRLAVEQPVGVRKMSGDESEKFHLEYWQFDGSLPLTPEAPLLRRPHILGQEYGNVSMVDIPLPPFLLHSSQSNFEADSLLRFFRRDNIFRRSFECPSGTSSCSSISRPDSCCAAGESCMLIEDTGLGDVGCCPQGLSCSGGVSSCDTDAGYSSCPGSSNGGCCIPNFECQGVGCVIANTVTIYPPLPTTTSSRTPTTSSSPPPSTSEEPSTSTPTTTTRTTQATLVCSTGFRSCPASQGGGCCPTDRDCGSPGCPPFPSSTGNPVAPVRPTSGSSGSTETTTSPPPSTFPSDGACPTGFYMCSAYYRGGCCRVGRNCDSTDCPSPATATVINTNGVTIAAPSGATAAENTGSCASGWFNCAPGDGGGCCPSGFECGLSCTATGSMTGTIGKMPPSTAASVEVWEWLLGVGAAIVGVGMVML
ncbi:hypothetical protein M501DRAFT_1014808 [Patellaria atrata CBS 101060]|uniref:GPI anchored protein n=1 Tax=Patellaria atrata CBS 101060 TaxID=1346257 RepID=A0A9P4SDL9_9PEZI|nr:hypothetical protein M501DRAFT_1014808 [Patellaria atrata CBS 101060]